MSHVRTLACPSCGARFTAKTSYLAVYYTRCFSSASCGALIRLARAGGKLSASTVGTVRARVRVDLDATETATLDALEAVALAEEES